MAAASSSGSRIRMNYSEVAEEKVNQQINMEFGASYLYRAMAAFFARDDQALHGFAKFFQVGGRAWVVEFRPTHLSLLYGDAG